MWCFHNSMYVKAEDLRISPFDHGYLYGLGVFETLRTYDGKPFLWHEHFTRMQEALSVYHIQLPYTEQELHDVIMELNVRNGGDDGYFRVNVSAGEAGIGLAKTTYDEPTVIVFRKPLELPPRGAEKNAVWLDTVRNSPEQHTRFKSHHYANNIVARFEVPSLASLEGFFLNDQGYVAEGITSNIFWVTDGIIYTPALSTGILPGITRAHVMTLTPVIEGTFTKEDMLRADECFITTSIQELIPIRAVGDKQFAGSDGAVYQELHARYIETIKES
ncbi:aminodeoxychorismate lyase [Kurthia sp. Dielmo]|uniref:aminodeoxychorismate lyase n=1 Tax=Kurthia sp. Dielmo TaxID=1033738 RepID=UPI001121E67D|nr:aminodeoxychorismate lyase [Kurthia sp. Dielmo]